MDPQKRSINAWSSCPGQSRRPGAVPDQPQAAAPAAPIQAPPLPCALWSQPLLVWPWHTLASNLWGCRGDHLQSHVPLAGLAGIAALAQAHRPTDPAAASRLEPLARLQQSIRWLTAPDRGWRYGRQRCGLHRKRPLGLPHRRQGGPHQQPAAGSRGPELWLCLDPADPDVADRPAGGAGAAGALNMWYESDLDALMSRTCLRPIPTGKVNKNQALIFGITLSVISVIALDYFTNRISAGILLFTIIFYVLIYTIWLKKRTSQNIVIGGAAGALPPVIGWTIATGSLSLEPLVFFLIIFFWTPSHFWALSLYKSEDYKKANIPMLPLTNGIESTKVNIFVYSLIMLPVIIFPYVINFVGLVFLIPSLLLTIYYNYLCFDLYKFKKNKFSAKKAKSIFGYSILYLFLVFVLFLIDKIL